VHARLDALAASSRQHPERRFRPGASLAVAGEPSEEVFMITSGWCEATRRAAGAFSGDDAHELVGQRRAGNLVGETEEAAAGETTRAERGGGDEKSKSEAKSSDVHASFPVSKLTVTAKTEVRALVFARSDVRWATGHDYRLSDEFEAALRRRRRIVVKQSRLAARAERAAREHAPLFGDADAFAGASRSGRRATSEIIKR
jgi:CRP-like cAMP-binding protein